jgi:hypothetical protein
MTKFVASVGSAAPSLATSSKIKVPVVSVVRPVNVLLPTRVAAAAPE